jgi:hypothetical protein
VEDFKHYWCYRKGAWSWLNYMRKAWSFALRKRVSNNSVSLKGDNVLRKERPLSSHKGLYRRSSYFAEYKQQKHKRTYRSNNVFKFTVLTRKFNNSSWKYLCTAKCYFCWHTVDLWTVLFPCQMETIRLCGNAEERDEVFIGDNRK